MFILRALTLASLLTLGACSTGQGHVSTTPPATDAQRKQLFDQVASLAGTWESKDDQGQMRTTNVFAVTAGGSAVREIMFPGGQHEMTNLYHMDGPSMILTHYCASGNQPRMRAVPGDKPQVFEFKFDSVTDLHNANDAYMGQMRMTIVDKDHVKQEWYSYADGKLGTEPTIFDLTRKR